MIIAWTPGCPQRAHETTTCPTSSGGPDQAVAVDPILALIVPGLDTRIDLLGLRGQPVSFEIQAKRLDPCGKVPIRASGTFVEHLIDRLIESHALRV